MAVLLSGCMLAGCATVHSDGPTQTKTFVGIVRVVVPENAGRLSAIDVRTLGVGWDSGPFLGWRAGNWIYADPGDCQMLIVIRSPAQAENAARVIESLGGQNACIADFTE